MQPNLRLCVGQENYRKEKHAWSEKTDSVFQQGYGSFNNICNKKKNRKSTLNLSQVFTEHYDQIRCRVTRFVIIITTTIIIIIVYNGRESFVRYHGRIVGALCARESTYTATVHVTHAGDIGVVYLARARLFCSLRRSPYLDKLAPKLYAHTFYIM